MVSRRQNLIAELGILEVDLDRKLGSMLPPLRRSSGVIVGALVADGPYWKTLFQPGDAIYRVNRTAVHSLSDLRSAMAAVEPGHPVVVQLERQGQMVFVPFELD